MQIPTGGGPIAIIGMDCRLPGAASPDELWSLLESGVDGIEEVPKSRFDIDQLYDPTPGAPGKTVSRWGGFLRDIDRFDPEFFGISPREARFIDPQHRLLLEVAAGALDRAGHPELGSVRAGVFVGIIGSDYEALIRASVGAELDVISTTGSNRSAAAARISYWLGLEGPSLVVDTDRSSSLVAVHLACRSLHLGECELALAGGANLILSPATTLAFSRSGMLAADGRCKFADRRADGFVRAEGVGLVVLKRLEDALRDGDPVRAVIVGSALNNGGRSGGDLMAPSGPAQEALLRDALEDAGLPASAVSYVEAHGPGTPRGDPIELTALGAVLGAGRPAERPCLVGSIKSNLGHAEGAAGIAGLIKVVLALEHDEIPASLHFESPPPSLDLAALGLAVVRERRPWPEAERRIAGVSSFGLTGTNAHLLCAEPPPAPERAPGASRAELVLLSAHTEEALHALTTRLHERAASEQALPDLAYSSTVRRRHLRRRLAAVAASGEELAAVLESYLVGDDPPDVVAGSPEPEPGKLAFVCSGHGGQWLGMGRALSAEPAFAEALARCEEALRPRCGFSVRDELFAEESASRLRELDVAQVTLFAFQVALAALLRAWGVEPDAVVGHSMGEAAAAQISGALSLEDAAAVISDRSRLMKRTAGQGGMAVVGLPAPEVEQLLARYPGRLELATINSPTSSVISGELEALHQLTRRLASERPEVFSREVKVDVAAHGPQMEPLRAELRAALAGLRPRATAVPLTSTVTGAAIDGEALDASYWEQNLRRPVRFLSAVESLLASGVRSFLEIGPHPVLWVPLGEIFASAGVRAVAIASTRREEGERRALLRALGRLHVEGHRIDWRRLYPRGRVVDLPPYPWQRRRFWYAEGETGTGATAAAAPASTEETPPAGEAPVESALQRRLRTAATTEERLAILLEHLRRQVAMVMGYAPGHPLDARRPFKEIGLTSLMSVELRNRVARSLRRTLPATLLFSYPTIAQLAEHLAAETEGPRLGPLGRILVQRGAVSPDQVRHALEEQTRGGSQERLGSVLIRLGMVTPEQLGAALRSQVEEPVAIVGMACRFPGASSLEAFWRLLREGRSAISEVPAERWDLDEIFDPDPDRPGHAYTKWGGFIDGIDLFDSAFFGISPREAAAMDPQQRLLLEVVWEALEHAGQSPQRLQGSSTAVIVGLMNYNDYAKRKRLTERYDRITAYDATADSTAVAVGRVAYLLDLQGPALAVDTACSSSLVAIHLACQSLKHGECRLALAGGVNVMLSPEPSIMFSRTRMMSPRGRCHTFDASADGYVRGEGCGVVVLKRLADAIADRDRVLAVIGASAINQDGRSSGLTAPNELAQQAVIRAALAGRGLSPARVSYVEAHGTGTPLGDPIEIQALAATYGVDRAPDRRLAVGSVKTAIGHLEAAAGVAGLIKVVLALQHEEIPPHGNLQRINPHIPFDRAEVVFPTSAVPWSRDAQSRVAGVSAFGFSGTNVHLLVEDESAVEPVASAGVDRAAHLLCLSAKTPSALRALAERYQRFLESDPTATLANICWTANAGRSHFGHRLTAVTESKAQLAAQLAAFCADRPAPGLRLGTTKEGTTRPVAFLFTGQGSEYPGMARELYQTHPRFRATLERYAEELERHGVPLLTLLFDERAPELLRRTENIQPALYAVENALAELWRSFGIEPAALIGYGVGEYAAGAQAGVFDFAGGARLVTARGRLMQPLPEGAQVAVFAELEAVERCLQLCTGVVSVAAENGVKHVVLAGETTAIEELISILEQRGLPWRRLPVSRAFHSPLLDPMLEEFWRVAAEVPYSRPHTVMISNVTGAMAERRTQRRAGAELIDVGEATYWVAQTRAPVRFGAGMSALEARGIQVYLEVGPTPNLIAIGRRCVDESRALWLPTLTPERGAWAQILETLAELYLAGVSVDWEAIDRDYPRQRVALPSYPFERARHWLEVETSPETTPLHEVAPPSEHPLLGRRLEGCAVHVFESRVGSGAPSYLAEHRVHGLVIVPATVYLELALEAAQAALGPGRWQLEGVSVREALVLANGEERVLQVVVVPEGGAGSFHIYSLGRTPPEWTEHAQGRLVGGGA